MNLAGLAAQAAAYVTSRASAVISTAISSLVGIGATKTETASIKLNKASILIRITSFSSIVASTVAKKIENFLTANIAIVRNMNPRARVQIKKTSNAILQETNVVERQGFYEFSNSLEELSAQIDSIISIESTKSIENIREQLKAYPPPPMNSPYNRTFTLQQGWDAAEVSFNLNTNIENTGRVNAPFGESATTVSISNKVQYTKWVQQKSTQTAVHRGRWNTIEDISYDESIELSNRIDDAIQRII